MSDEEPPDSPNDSPATSSVRCEVLFDIQRQQDQYRFRCELYDRGSGGAEVRFFEGQNQLFTRTYVDHLAKDQQLVGRTLALVLARTMGFMMEKAPTTLIERSLPAWRE